MGHDCYLLMKRKSTGSVLFIEQPVPQGAAAEVAINYALRDLPGWGMADWNWSREKLLARHSRWDPYAENGELAEPDGE